MSLFYRETPKIKNSSTKKDKDGFSGWNKCKGCSELIHIHEIEKHDNCCPKCNYHYLMPVSHRIESLADAGSFKELFIEFQPIDALRFFDSDSYENRISKAQKKSGADESVTVGICQINGVATALGILNFNFMAGTMGSVLGERLTSLIEYATQHRLPLIIVSASGGARMQESVLSLMQMAKISAALARFHEKGLLYISVLTNPTCGGTTASFATLGDIIIAEPNALICFAGPRVIEQTLKQKIPEDAQRSEFLLKHGMIDCIAARKDLKQKLSDFIQFFTQNSSTIQYVNGSSSNSSFVDELNELMHSADKKLEDLLLKI